MTLMMCGLHLSDPYPVAHLTPSAVAADGTAVGKRVSAAAAADRARAHSSAYNRFTYLFRND